MIKKEFYYKLIFICAICLMAFFIKNLYAIRNICKYCKEILQLEDTVCTKCGNPANLCLKCNHKNMVKSDFCEICNSPLAEMRILSTIATDVRNELKLGQSERAQLEQELKKIDYLMSKHPDKKETYLYQKAKIYRKMNFYAREVETWKEFLSLYPNSKHKNSVKYFLSDSLRKWGYLFYSENKKNLALEKFKQAVEINPSDVEAWRWIGRIYKELDNNKEAAEAYLEALKQKPGDPATIYFLRQIKHQIPENLLKPIKNTNINTQFLQKPSIEKSTKELPSSNNSIISSPTANTPTQQ